MCHPLMLYVQSTYAGLYPFLSLYMHVVRCEWLRVCGCFCPYLDFLTVCLLFIFIFFVCQKRFVYISALYRLFCNFVYFICILYFSLTEVVLLIHLPFNEVLPTVLLSALRTFCYFVCNQCVFFSLLVGVVQRIFNTFSGFLKHLEHLAFWWYIFRIF